MHVRSSTSHFLLTRTLILLLSIISLDSSTLKRISKSRQYKEYVRGPLPLVVPKGFYYLPNSCCCGNRHMEGGMPKKTLGSRQSEKDIWIHKGHPPPRLHHSLPLQSFIELGLKSLTFKFTIR